MLNTQVVLGSWDPYQEHHVKKIEMVQRRSAVSLNISTIENQHTITKGFKMTVMGNQAKN